MTEPIDSTETKPPPVEVVILPKDADGKANASELDDASVSVKQVSEAGTIASNENDDQSTFNQSRAPRTSTATTNTTRSFRDFFSRGGKDPAKEEISNMTEEEKDLTRKILKGQLGLENIAGRTHEQVKAIGSEMKENHQQLMSKLDEQKEALAEAVVERMEQRMEQLVQQQVLRTPARGSARAARTPMSSRRSEKRSLPPPRSAARTSSRKSACRSVKGFTPHVDRIRTTGDEQNKRQADFNY